MVASHLKFVRDGLKLGLDDTWMNLALCCFSLEPLYKNLDTKDWMFADFNLQLDDRPFSREYHSVTRTINVLVK
jgi:hypothetical protein